MTVFEQECKIYFPYYYRYLYELSQNPGVYLYNACLDHPGLCGGRESDSVKRTLVPREQILAASALLGPRFLLNANSVFPELDNSSEETLSILNSNQSGIIISSPDFATRVHSLFPHIQIHASCIMSFYRPFQEIAADPIFTGVCAPQTENYNPDKMLAMVPHEHLHKVSFIVNSQCKWTPRCKYHYENSSLQYFGKTSPEWDSNPLHIVPLECKSMDKRNFRALKISQALYERGVRSFKIEGRESVNPDTDIRPCLDLLLAKEGYHQNRLNILYDSKKEKWDHNLVEIGLSPALPEDYYSTTSDGSIFVVSQKIEILDSLSQIVPLQPQGYGKFKITPGSSSQMYSALSYLGDILRLPQFPTDSSF